MPAGRAHPPDEPAECGGDRHPLAAPRHPPRPAVRAGLRRQDRAERREGPRPVRRVPLRRPGVAVRIPSPRLGQRRHRHLGHPRHRRSVRRRAQGRAQVQPARAGRRQVPRRREDGREVDCVDGAADQDPRRRLPLHARLARARMDRDRRLGEPHAVRPRRRLDGRPKRWHRDTDGRRCGDAGCTAPQRNALRRGQAARFHGRRIQPGRPGVPHRSVPLLCPGSRQVARHRLAADPQCLVGLQPRAGRQVQRRPGVLPQARPEVEARPPRRAQRWTSSTISKTAFFICRRHATTRSRRR